MIVTGASGLPSTCSLNLGGRLAAPSANSSGGDQQREAGRGGDGATSAWILLRWAPGKDGRL